MRLCSVHANGFILFQSLADLPQMDFPPAFPATNARHPGGGWKPASAARACVSGPDLGAGEKINPISAARFLFLENDTRLRIYILKHAKLSQRNCAPTGSAGKAPLRSHCEGPAPDPAYGAPSRSSKRHPSWHPSCWRTAQACTCVAVEGLPLGVAAAPRPVHPAQGAVAQSSLREHP